MYVCHYHPRQRTRSKISAHDGVLQLSTHTNHRTRTFRRTLLFVIVFFSWFVGALSVRSWRRYNSVFSWSGGRPGVHFEVGFTILCCRGLRALELIRRHMDPSKQNDAGFEIQLFPEKLNA